MKKKFSEEAYSAKMTELAGRCPSFASSGSIAYKPGLDRSLSMDERLGFPSRELSCIHVAGTNGKGSVCNMLAASFASLGMKVGLYTSPHFLDFRERIRTVTCDGWKLIPKEMVWDFLAENEDAIGELGLSYFEITTAMCFKHFAEEHVDIAIIETGLGGRFDATNIITPKLSVITNIGLDHMDILGDSISRIAFEKAGIIKAGVPVVIGEYDSESAPVFMERAAEAGARIVFASDMEAEGLPAPDEMDLGGWYQKMNLRTVACALKECGLDFNPDVLKKAACICGFHGRWEIMSRKPLIICDIGHNAHGLRHNFAQLEQMLQSGEITDLVMVYGSVKDKDFDAVLDLIPQEAYVYFVSAANPRAMDAGVLREHALNIAGESCRNVEEAVKLALERCSGKTSPLIYIGGSTYVVSEAVIALESLKISKT